MNGLDPDALRAAVASFHDGPHHDDKAAIAAAINAYLDAADAEARARLDAFMTGLANFKIELEKLRQAIAGEAPWGSAP